MHTAELLEGSQDLETSIPWSTSIMLDKSKVPSKCSVELKLATWILDANKLSYTQTCVTLSLF